MATFFGIGFASPWLLLGLAALPILWIVLRAVPPAPVRRPFPGVALLAGLSDDESQSERTPWWLLLLRMLALAAAIIGFAGPVLNPQERSPASGPLLIVLDGTWADARDWSRRMERVAVVLDEAERSARPVALVLLSDLPPGDLPFRAASAWRSRLPGIAPSSWEPQPAALEEWAASLEARPFDTFWLSDGLARPGREAVLAALEARGTVTVFESPQPVLALRGAEFAGEGINVTALRAGAQGRAAYQLRAIGPDPTGTERQLASGLLAFDAGATEAIAELALPPELRNRVSRFEIAGQRSAGAVSLTDDSLKRREVALIAGRSEREGLELLSPLYYLRQALAPAADLIEGDFSDILLASPDVIILADVARLADAEASALLEWVREGGILVRFAGPRLAASDVARNEEDPLMPVRLRAGGRSVGGTMSWGEPKALRPFAKDSPFFGLPIPADVRVSAQVMARPDPQLSERVIAALADGTPLVTRKFEGTGQVVLFHVTANAEWSSLPLSGLFVQMLERLAVSTRPERPGAAELAGTTWTPVEVLDAFGAMRKAGALAGVPGERIAEGAIGPDMPPGLYAGAERRIAVNVIAPGRTLQPAAWPARIAVEGLDVVRETALKGWLLTLALALLMADIIASLWLSGRLRGARAAALPVLLAALLTAPPQPVGAQGGEAGESFALDATANTVLAYVLTGDSRLDAISEAGLRGLSDVLFRRTSVEPADPIGVDLERDELSFFPFLYWPVTPDQPIPSAEAYVRLNRYLRTGGMIMFDTRDADLAGLGTDTPNRRKLQQLAAPLDIPPLEPVPADHVLTRAFYLLQDFPGRYASREVWVEAAPPGAELVEGMPFRNLNDNVTPVIIGGNDWAAAWAVDNMGGYMFPVGRGNAGDRQRELAYRFGVNLVMYVLTGNYKSDQVHVPALLERLGQ